MYTYKRKTIKLIKCGMYVEKPRTRSKRVINITQPTFMLTFQILPFNTSTNTYCLTNEACKNGGISELCLIPKS